MVTRAKTTMVYHPQNMLMIDNRVRGVGSAIANAVANDARDMAPMREGDLMASIKVVRARPYLWHVRVGTDHWWEQEYGARPHEIVPKVKRALWWTEPPAGKGFAEYPRTRVWHPGNAPQPYMRPALFQRRRVWVTPTGGIAVVMA